MKVPQITCLKTGKIRNDTYFYLNLIPCPKPFPQAMTAPVSGLFRHFWLS